MYDDLLPPGLSQKELEARDEEIEDTDTGFLDDDSDDFDSLEERLEPLLENLQ